MAAVRRRIGGFYKRPKRRISSTLGIDARTSEGRFARGLQSALLAELGESPTVVQKLTVLRAVQIQLQLLALDEKLTAGDFTDHDRRVYGALNNAYRLLLRDIAAGCPDKPDKRRTLATSLLQALAEPKGTGSGGV